MAKRFFYVKGDDKKAPVDLTKQAKGTELVCVTPSGKEVNFKVGEMFVNPSKKLSKSEIETDPEAIAYIAECKQRDAERASLAAKMNSEKSSSAPVKLHLSTMSPEEKAQKIAAAKAKAALTKAAAPAPKAAAKKA